MEITIKSEFDITDFVYGYLPKFILNQFLNNVDHSRLKAIDSYFKIDSFNLMLYSLKNLRISKYGEFGYIIQEDKNLKYKGEPIQGQLLSIAYGNRDIIGYPIIKDILKCVSSNIKGIYKEWEGGY